MKKILLFLFIGLLNLGVVFAACPGKEPNAVESAKAKSLDQSVELSWNEATDEDGVVKGYKVYYGTKSVTPGSSNNYDMELEVGGGKTSHTIPNLKNGIAYYFAITAVDDQECESIYYSDEVSATPKKPMESGLSVLKAIHVAPTKILVEMSKAVKLDDPKESFTLTNDDNSTGVPVLDSEIKEKNVMLTVGAGTVVAGSKYKIVATSGVTDLDGNPMSSGITDNIKFIAKETFDDLPKTLDLSGYRDFGTIPSKAGTEKKQNTTSSTNTANTTGTNSNSSTTPNTNTTNTTGTTSTNNTSTHASANEDEYKIQGEENISEDDNFLDTFLDDTNTESTSGSQNIGNLGGTSQPKKDTTAPQDARNLAIKNKESILQKGTIKITWKPAVDIDGDVVDQILYTRVGIGKWDEGYSLGKSANNTEIDVLKNKNYQIRLVTVDDSGNESYGAELSFSTSLSTSGGSGTFMALGAALFFGLVLLFGSRKTA